MAFLKSDHDTSSLSVHRLVTNIDGLVHYVHTIVDELSTAIA